MKRNQLQIPLLVSLALAVCLASSLQAGPPTTAITYQGKLTSNGTGANGRYDLRFGLSLAPSGGAITALTTNLSVEVTNGLFTALVDFGGDPTSIGANYLETAVRTNGAGPFSVLAPRQLLTATPYSFDALHASSALSAVTAAGVAPGSIVGSSIAPGAIVAANVNANSFSNTFWGVTGNPGTTPGINFLGTSDNQPLEIKVNGSRALRLEPGPYGNPNVIAGSDQNTVAAGVTSATIGGGGWGMGSGHWNVVNANGGTISGGLVNSIGTASEDAVIGGGWHNLIGTYCISATISGGVNNTMEDDASGSIGGGGRNVIRKSAGAATIAGGLANIIGERSYWASIGGGYDNTNSGQAAVIAGGHLNLVTNYGGTISGGEANANLGKFGAIAGGNENFIGPNGMNSSLGGGWRNSLTGYESVVGGGNQNTNDTDHYGVIGGGARNRVSGFAGTVAGGQANTIASQANHGAIGGGELNFVADSTTHATIGGANNLIEGSAANSVIGGGWYNKIRDSAGVSVLGGGSNNRLETNASYAVLGGGLVNVINNNAQYAVLSGGALNSIGANAWYATVAGGDQNQAKGTNSLAAGHRAIAQKRGSFVWADAKDFEFDPYAQSGPQGIENSFNVRSTGGFYIVTGVNATNGVIVSGLYLPSGGGAWVTLSDRNSKDNLQAVNPRQVLEKVAALPLSTWNYKTQDGSIRHLGPMAQDFQAAFNLGESDTGINTVDADGVALAAIQGLNLKLEQKLRAKDAELQALKERLAAIEQRLDQAK